MENYFEHLTQISVSEHIERKGQYSYLSWPYAVQELRLADPKAYWEVRRFDGLPYLKTETGYFVEVAVTVQGVTLSQIHPVLDADNRPIAAPTCFEINTSVQRALVKSIALHGLGLSVYAGEDLPKGTGKPAPQGNVSTLQPTAATAAQIKYIERLINDTGSDLQKVLAYFHVSALRELTRHAASRAIKSLEKTKRRAA